MLIECLIRRPKGTTITLGDRSYRFAPDDDGRHVAEVDDEAHVAILLSIKDGYRPADGSVIADVSELGIDGPFFIVRGPQDAKAVAHWAACIPDMLSEPAKYTLLIDKIALGEASLGDFQLVPEPASSAPGAPPAAGHSPQPPADNTILPDQRQPGDAGEGGAGDVGGTGADTQEEPGGKPSETTLDREALAVRYAEIHGHRPNGKWSAEKIAEVLAQQE